MIYNAYKPAIQNDRLSTELGLQKQSTSAKTERGKSLYISFFFLRDIIKGIWVPNDKTKLGNTFPFCHFVSFSLI